MSDDVSLSVGFDVDEAAINTAFEHMVQNLSTEFENVGDVLKSSQSVLQGMIAPMRELRDLAKDFSEAFRDVKASSKDIKDAVTSTRLQAGLGAGGGVVSGGIGGRALGAIGGRVLGAAGGMVGLGSLASIAGPIATAVTGALAVAIPAAVASSITSPTAKRDISDVYSSMFGDTAGGAIGSVLSAVPFAERLFRSVGGGPSQNIPRGVQLGPQRQLTAIERVIRGDSLTDVMREVSSPELAASYGAIRGVMGGMGQGPVGMMSQVIGGAVGARGGFNVGERYGGFGGGVVGAELGRGLVAGMVERYIQEGMQRYPGYLATRASMATPAMYGADVRMLRRLRPARFGIGPEQFGPEFSGLYQGFGGGALTADTARTAMAYSRLYGVGMGQIGQAMGGLINIGGGGQYATEQQREQMMLRIMTDAVAAGFGRRLPEFAQSISGSMSAVLQGPGLVRQEDMQVLTEEISQITSRIARTQGVGLQQAGRMVAPWLQAPGAMARGIISGGGDPWSIGLTVASHRGRFRNLYEMVFGRPGAEGEERTGGLLQAQSDPFGVGMEFMAPTLSNILSSASRSVNPQDVAMADLSRHFQGLGIDMPLNLIGRLVDRGLPAITQAQREGRSELTPEELRDVIGDLEATQEDEGEELRNTMRDIQARSEQLMNDQLSALRGLARFQQQQLAISGAMAADAATFHAAQMAETMAASTMVSRSEMGDIFQNLNRARREAARTLQGQTADGRRLTPEDYETYISTIGRASFNEFFNVIRTEQEELSRQGNQVMDNYGAPRITPEEARSMGRQLEGDQRPIAQDRARAQRISTMEGQFDRVIRMLRRVVQVLAPPGISPPLVNAARNIQQARTVAGTRQ